MANTSDRVLLDANILIELVLQRSRYKQVAEAVVSHAAAGHAMVTSILSVDLLLYFVERDKADKALAHEFLQQYEILDMNQADYLWAQVNDMGDFEDALQVACALRHDCAKMLTLDKALARRHAKHIATKLIR